MNAVPGISAARYTGQRVLRKEDGRLLTGRGQFVDDISLPGMLHAAFARSPIARGDIRSIDTTAAREVPGVQAIYTQADLARFGFAFRDYFLTPYEFDYTPLANGRVAYVGEPVAIVLAESRAIAEDAAALIEIDYDEQDPVVTLAQARAMPAIHPDLEDNIAVEIGDDEPDEELAAALAGAAHVITQKVIHQRIAQSPMETRGVIAAHDGPDELTVWITCASPHLVARWLSLSLGLPDAAIRVIARDVGGSFGFKNLPYKEEVSAILAAKLIARPVKWIEDRWECLTAASQAREAEMVLKAGFDAEGRLVGSHGDYICANGAYPQGLDANIAVHMFLWSAYRMPAYQFVSRGAFSNTPGLCAYRGPWAMESLIRETMLDKAARQIGIDPIEIRRRNLIRRADLPCTTSMGLPLEDISPAECLEKLLEHFDVPAFREEQAEARKAGRYLGLGISTYIEPTGAAGGIPIMTGELAQVRIDPTGKVTACMSTHSQGHGTATTMAQLVADQLGVRYEDVTVFEGDNTRGGFTPGAGGSRQGVIAGGAAIKASAMLADKVKAVAAHLLNASPEAITLADGKVHVDGAPEMTRSLREIAEIAYGEPARLPEGMETGLEMQHRFQPPPMTFTSAAHACVVEVDGETGFVRILRWISSEDCGTVINPAVVEGQIAGGLAQAIGMVLLEEMPFDARGNPQAATFKDYLLPAISDVPVFEYVHANTPSQSLGGMRGVGEGGAIIGPPTLVNAIADALSPFGEIEELALPLTPVKLLSLIEGRDLAAHSAPSPVEVVAPPAAPSVAPEPAPNGPATVDGAWNAVLKTPMGPQAMTITFVTEGTAVSGRFDSPEGSQPFSGGVLEGNRVRFDLKVEKPMKITLKYDLMIEGDALSGKCKMGMFGSAKVSGKRAS